MQIGSGMTTDPTDGRDVWMVPIKITIPLWQNRLIPEVREAKRNLAATQAQLKQTENMTAAEVKEAYARFMTARQVAVLAEHALIPEAQLAARSAQAAYETGETDALNLIDSQRLYLNAKISYYEAVAETVKSFAALERAVGVDLTNFSRPSGGSR
jgi:outer membrane protein TolC